MWRIVVKEGQQVGADETLMILESMKMEIPINGPKAGRVAKIQGKESQSAQEGQQVGAHEALMLLESMKMEIPINAPKAGRVAKIHVKEGQTVQEGALL